MFPGFDQWIRHQEHYNHYNWDTGGTHFTSQMGSHDFSKIECIRIGYRSSVIKYLTLVVPSRSLRMLQYLEGSHSFFRALAGTCLRHRFVCTQFLIHHLTWVEKNKSIKLVHSVHSFIFCKIEIEVAWPSPQWLHVPGSIRQRAGDLAPGHLGTSWYRPRLWSLLLRGRTTKSSCSRGQGRVRNARTTDLLLDWAKACNKN